ncbi:uncharacterized protein [Ambystoma mexicanum]|uniref:uncharacterized protein isoform X2 n=1 Tax=Ambystoma mexicanum TaxID=8296 RepID=UPI0037E90318
MEREVVCGEHRGGLIGASLATSLEGSDGGKAKASLTEHSQAAIGLGYLKEEMVRPQKGSSSTLRRFHEVEEVRQLRANLREEKTLWSSRYHELLQEQERLNQQVTCERETSQQVDAPAAVKHRTYPNTDAADGKGCLLSGGGDALHRRTGVNSNEKSFLGVSSLCHQGRQEVMSTQSGHSLSELGHWNFSAERSSNSSFLTSFSSGPSAGVSRAGGSHRPWNHSSHCVYIPRSPLNLKSGRRVKLILPSGKVGVGAIRYLGNLPERVGLYVGVVLESPAPGLRDGVFAGHCYFSCKPGRGVFVPFSKVLLAWE